MYYRAWAKSARKEWLPKEGPIVLLRQVPPGKTSVLKIDLKKCVMVADIRDNVQKLQVRMTMAQLEWWKEMADKEAKGRDQWEALTPEDFCKAGESFDLFDFAFQHAEPDPEEDEKYGKRNEKLLQLIAKKENQKPVS